MDSSRDFHGAVSEELLRWENEVIRRHFDGVTVAAWERDDAYHAYHLTSDLAVGRRITLDYVWYQYRLRPAPTIQPKTTPVRTGEWSLALTATTLGDTWLPIPLPGGPVKHYVSQEHHAIINATMTGHLLHPGTIMRFINVARGPVFESHTVGRGTGILPSVNEVMGLEIFDELDNAIRQKLP